MAIQVTQSPCAPEFTGEIWALGNYKKLIHTLAVLAVGQHLAVLEALQGLGKLPKATHKGAALAAIAQLKNESNLALRAHRDGWLFQLISWIALNQTKRPHDIVKAPQMRRAAHGFDAFKVAMLSKTNVEGVVICEQKATKSPRSTVTTKVWPEFRNFETGARDPELIGELSALLPHDRKLAIEITKKIHWDEQRFYHVAITTPTPLNASRMKELFSGYESVVIGNTKRRAAAAIQLKPLRKTLRQISSDVSQAISNMNWT